ncbi:inositol 1,4,5-trisphosphate receptor-interacting protein-like 1 [Pogoniulus pusillus]|uniref:inositol 1,4,5-trisphosphate receptor-interacting protein-like 1 n=1 Tax=Pogoniulus pusillus TaxID=488313 RepID=UPI0030B945D1
MDATKFVALLLQGLVLFSVKVHEELDETTWQRMQERENEMDQEMVHMMQEMERRSQLHWKLVSMLLQQWPEEHGMMAWGAVLFAATAAVFVLLFWLCCWLRRKSPDPDSVCFRKISDASTYLAEEEDEEEEEGDVEGLKDVKQVERSAARHLRWPVQKMISRSREVKRMVNDLLQVLQERLSKNSLPVLQPAIGVGSAFEGWCPYEEDYIVYHLLVPMKPPRGHVFSLELETTETPAKDCRIRVGLKCTCIAHRILRFVRNSKRWLSWRKKKTLSLLDILCTQSYLDVEKVTCWFQGLVKEAWVALPQAREYELKVMSFSQRSCLLQLISEYRGPLNLQIMFGVQQGDTDIFFSSQTAEDTYTPSTIWKESYAVAEGKFFRHIARQVPRGSFHLRCLYFCSHLLDGTNITPYMLKTSVMHLLNTTPVTGWRKSNGTTQVAHILSFLKRCLEQKQLNHFFFGNSNMPKEITLTPHFETSEPLNLLENLVENPAAHARAMRQLKQLQKELAKGIY